MLQSKCTTKVHRELGIKPNKLAEARPGDSLLGNWCVNLFTVDGRKTLVSVNQKTLLSFVIFGVN
jgi:hypothetical protein